jgi:hypothetical protein
MCEVWSIMFPVTGGGRAAAGRRGCMLDGGLGRGMSLDTSRIMAKPAQLSANTQCICALLDDSLMGRCGTG